MSLPADYHMHTPLCRHASGEPTELAAQAVHLGLTEIGFSEHNPMIRDDWDEWHMLQADLDTYVEKVQQARRDHQQLHTPLCRHASGEPTELAAQAVHLGLTEIGFSEHNPMIRDDWDEWH